MRCPPCLLIVAATVAAGATASAPAQSESDYPPADPAILARLEALLDPATLKALDSPQREQLAHYARRHFENDDPVARCWAPDTPIEILRAYHAVEEAARRHTPAPRKDGDADDPPPAPAKQFFRRWAHTATNGPGQNPQGLPITLTWSIVPDGTPIPGDPSIGDPSAPSDLRARLAEIYGGDSGPPQDQPWFPRIEAIFDNVTAQTGINYLYEANDDGKELGRNFPGQLGGRGDIRLGGHPIDGNGATLAYNFYPDNGDMVIDTDDNWYENTGNDSIRLRNTLEHEHGHGIGMEHVCPIDHTKLMEPFINTSFRGLQFDEVYTLQRWYGDYYEHHSSARNNDSFANAAPLPVAAGAPFASAWLSIDDVSDVDFFAVPLPAGHALTARVTPSSLAYIEGGQTSSGTCTSGITFDPSAHHDLHLALFGPDQDVALASSNAHPAGHPEEIVRFLSPQEGTHFLRVSGSSAGSAQLYRLEVTIEPPGSRVLVEGTGILAESFHPGNQVIDPGETVALEVALRNAGNLPSTALEAALAGPAGFVGLDTIQDYGTLAPLETARRTFIFGLEGACGESFTLALELRGDDGFEAALPLKLTLGTVEGALEESFDDSPSGLPPDWSSATNGAGSGWRVSFDRFESAPASLVTEPGDTAGTSSLLSPAVTLGTGGGTLSFRHFFDTEAGVEVGYDGGVLEVSMDGGPWQDILAAGATFAQGGYVRTLGSEYDNPLPNRPAWSGDSAGWITTVAELPPSFANVPLRFRWTLGHDASVGVSDGYEGWFLDELLLTSTLCNAGMPIVHLVVDDDIASEFAPADFAQITIHAVLPPIAPLPVPLLNAGSATLGVDVTGLENPVLPAGESLLSLPIHAVNDGLVEGDESLILSIDPSAGLFVQGEPSVTITISDTPYGRWAATTLGLATANGPLEDLDRDGASNLEEYAWLSDGASAASYPLLAPRRDGGFLHLQAPLLSLPPDVLLGAETSLDLETWIPVEFETVAGGLRVPASDSTRFLRLAYRLLPAAP